MFELRVEIHKLIILKILSLEVLDWGSIIVKNAFICLIPNTPANHQKNCFAKTATFFIPPNLNAVCEKKFNAFDLAQNIRFHLTYSYISNKHCPKKKAEQHDHILNIIIYYISSSHAITAYICHYIIVFSFGWKCTDYAQYNFRAWLSSVVTHGMVD